MKTPSPDVQIGGGVNLKTPTPEVQIGGGGGLVLPKVELDLNAPKAAANLELNAPKVEVELEAPKPDINLGLGVPSAGAGLGVDMRVPAVGAELNVLGVGAGAGMDLGAGVDVGAGAAADLNVNAGVDTKRLSLQKMGVATPFAGFSGAAQLRGHGLHKAKLGLDAHLSAVPEVGAELHVGAPKAELDVTLPKPAISADVGGGAGLGLGVGVGGGMSVPAAKVEVEAPVPKARTSRLLGKPEASAGLGVEFKAPTLVRANTVFILVVSCVVTVLWPFAYKQYSYLRVRDALTIIM